MSKHKFIGPVTLEVVVHLMSEDGDTAKVTIGLAPGQPVSAEDLLNAIRQAAHAGQSHGMKPMGPSTFFNHVLVKEKIGRAGNFATPSDMYYELDTGMTDYEPEVSEDDEDLEDEDELDREKGG